MHQLQCNIRGQDINGLRYLYGESFCTGESTPDQLKFFLLLIPNANSIFGAYLQATDARSVTELTLLLKAVNSYSVIHLPQKRLASIALSAFRLGFFVENAVL